MTRLDVYLKDHFKTRTKAQDAIKEGRIKVNDIVNLALMFLKTIPFISSQYHKNMYQELLINY